MAESEIVKAFAAAGKRGQKRTPVVVGARFGRWTVIEEAEPIRSANPRNRLGYASVTAVVVECSCEQKTRRVLWLAKLRAGRTRSCGCLARERAAGQVPLLREATTLHGGYRTPEYQVWTGMRLRCRRSPCLRVCLEWDKSFSVFLRDVGPRPARGYRLRRLDRSKGFEPGNCVWAPAGPRAQGGA